MDQSFSQYAEWTYFKPKQERAFSHHLSYPPCTQITYLYLIPFFVKLDRDITVHYSLYYIIQNTSTSTEVG